MAGSGSLLLQLASGLWTASIGPVPSDAPGTGEVLGVYCAAAGACVATGTDFFVDGSGEGGMILTQSNGVWTAEDAPLPAPTESPRDGSVERHAEANAASDSSTMSSLAGVSCAIDGFCAAAGAEMPTEGFVETVNLPSLPSVTGLAPSSGPAAGGTSVAVTGTNFDAESVVSFGGVAASTSYVSATELQAVAPAISYAQAVDVTVTNADADVESRANAADLFSYFGAGTSTLAVTTTSLPPGAVKVAYKSSLQATGGNPPYKWSLAPGSTSLPPGLRLSPSGSITGKPKTTGIYNLTVQVADHKTKKTKTTPPTQHFAYQELSLAIT